ncbi:MAG: hypothetical protein ABSF83_10805 [Nitrososphaerales archaeon]|jgi:hypothetical protein
MPASEEGRRKFLRSVLPFALGAYLEAQRVLSPAGLVKQALDRDGGSAAADPEEEAREMLARVTDLDAKFEGGRLVVHIDRATALDLVEARLRRSFARSEAGMTAGLRRAPPHRQVADLDGEFRLSDRSIYLKFVPAGTPAAELTSSYLERARAMNPSELWLLTPGEEGTRVDVTFEPIFRERRITRGGLRTLAVSSVLRDVVGDDCDVVATQEGDGYRFLVARQRPPPAG